MVADEVASIGLKGTFVRKSVIIPGLFNKLSCLLPRFLPEGIVIRLSEKALSLRSMRKINNWY